MKHLTLALAFAAALYLTDDWWQLLAILPVLAMFETDGGSKKEKKQTRLSESKRRYRYRVETREGPVEWVECDCPVQFDRPYAHFTDEITEFGFHPHHTYRKPVQIKEVFIEKPDDDADDAEKH